MLMNMKAVIMAGGEGTRLRPITCSIPKPLAKIADRPVMSFILQLLKKHGISEAAATLMYLPSKITEFYDDGAEYGIKLQYFLEETPLGTAGSVKNCGSFLDSDFIVISGDALCDIDLTKAAGFHREKGADATLVLYKVKEPLEYGVTVTDSEGRIERFIEKPSWSKAYSDTVNTGIYILNRECLDLIPKDKPFDFAKDLFPLMLEKGMKLYGYTADGYWCDIGSCPAYLSCNLDVLDNKLDYKKEVPEIMPGVYSLSEITGGVKIEAPCIIGKDVRIEKGAAIGPYACIGDGCFIGESASIKRSVLYNGVSVGRRTQIRGAVLCSFCSVKDGASIYEGAVIGEKSVIGGMCEISPNVKVWPQKSTEDGAIISENIVWGGGFRELYDDDGITGEIGFDMTPEFCARIGAAFSGVKKGDIIIGNTNSAAAGMLAMAVAAGSVSVGADAYLAGSCSFNALRYAAVHFGFSGAAYVRQHDNRALIALLSDDGFELSRDEERKLSAAFIRDDFKRSPDKDIKEIKSFSQIEKLYETALEKFSATDLKNFKVNITADNELISAVFDKVISKLGIAASNEKNIPGIIIEEEGRSLRLRDEAGEEYSKERASVFLCYAAAESGYNEIYVPYSCPVSICLDEQKCIVKRVLNDDKTARRGYEVSPFMFDALFGAVFVLSYLKSKNITLKDAMKSVPSFTVFHSFAETDENKGFVMRSLTGVQNVKKELIEGIRLDVDNGNVLIVPSRRGKGFRITAEASDMETAKELCLDYSEKIKNCKEGGSKDLY